MAESDKDLLGVEEVAEYLGVGKVTVWRWCREGRLRCLKVGKLWRVRREALEDLLNRSEKVSPQLDEQLYSFMAVLPSHVALVDQSGTILAANDAWKAFAKANGGDLSRTAEGTNYLAVCDGATGSQSEYAASFAEGLRAVLSESEDGFEMEYPCHSPTERRWFIGSARIFAADSETLAVVAHEDTTERKLLEEQLRQLTGG